MEPRGYDERCRKPEVAMQEDSRAQQEIELEDEEYSRRMDTDEFQEMQQQRNNLQEIENLISIMPDNGTTPVTTDDEIEDGQIVEERKEEEEQKIQRPEAGSRRPPSGSTFTIRSRMYNQMMAKAYHRLITLYHFKIIRLGNNEQEAYEMEKWLVEGYLGHTGYRDSHEFPTPRFILDASDPGIARKLCIEHVQAIASLAEVNPDIKVIKWQSSRSRNPRREWIGTVMKLQMVHHRW